MSRNLKVVLLAILTLAISLPAGFAVAQVIDSPEAEQAPETRLDPDPSSNAIAEADALRKAEESGDQEAIGKTAEAVHAEWLSRLGEDDRKAAESAPPEVQVPLGTEVYIPPSMPEQLVTQCEALLRERGQEEVCELAILHDEGKVRSGAFSAEAVKDVLGYSTTEEGVK